MIYPNKNIKFKESILSKMLPILTYQSYDKIEIIELYNLVSQDFESVDEFILSLDVLYALETIEFDESLKSISYVI